MKFKPPCLPMDVVQDKVELIESTHGIDLGLEPERQWLWLTDTEAIKPLHWPGRPGKPASAGYIEGTKQVSFKGKTETRKYCVCSECAKRDAIRHELRVMGFIYKKEGHTLPTGSTGLYGNCCLAPRPFFRKNKGSKSTSAPTVPGAVVYGVVEKEEKEDMSALLADIGV